MCRHAKIIADLLYSFFETNPNKSVSQECKCVLYSNIYDVYELYLKNAKEFCQTE